MSTKFKPGQSGNPRGRPKAATNKVGRPLKSTISAFLTEQFQELPGLYKSLKPAEKARMLIDLLPYALPKLQSIAVDGELNLSGLSEADIDRIAYKLMNNEKNE